MARKTTNAANNVAANEAELIKGVTYDSEPLVDEDIDTTDEITAAKIEDGLYDPKKTQVELDGLATISKEVKKSVAELSDNQIRIIIDSYYQTQAARIALENQVRAVIQGYDENNKANILAVQWLLQDYKNRENQIKKMIEEYVKSVPVCSWAVAIKGIGPIFAANLYNYINMDICKHANQFLNYAGLNDNNIPWLGKEKAEAIVNEAYEECGLKKTDKLNDEILIKVAEKSGRKFETVLKGFESHREKTSTGGDRVVLIKYLSKPPYNKELKTICYLIGEAFCKVSNRGSLYGRIYRERKAWETMMNENLAYKEQAERMLREKKYDTNTPTYKLMAEGKLSPAHINQRAKRYATKIFLTHFFEACWIDKYGTKPPVIYPIAFQDHVDYIEPEVPYSDYISYKSEVVH